MTGENLKAGEHDQNSSEATRAELRGAGQKVLNAVDIKEVPGEEQAAAESVELSNEKIEEIIAQIVGASADRYGNEMSAESIKHLFDLAQNDPKAFVKETLELQQDFHLVGVEKGYMNAQKELAELLQDKTPEEFLRNQQALIDQLTGDLMVERASIVVQTRDLLQQDKVEAEKRLKAGRLAEIQGELDEAKRKFTLVQNLQMGNQAQPVPPRAAEEVLEQSEVNETEKPGEKIALGVEKLDVTSETYETEAKVRRAAIERAMKYMTPELGEQMMQALAEVEATEQEERKLAQTDFETLSGDNVGTDEEIAQAAAAEEAVLSQRVTRTQAQADREYRAGMRRLARESRPGRFDEVDRDTLAKNEYWNKVEQLARESKPGRFDEIDPILPTEAEVRKEQRELRKAQIKQRFGRIRERLTRRGGGAEKKQAKEAETQAGTVDYSGLEAVIAAMLNGQDV